MGRGITVENHCSSEVLLYKSIKGTTLHSIRGDSLIRAGFVFLMYLASRRRKQSAKMIALAIVTCGSIDGSNPVLCETGMHPVRVLAGQAVRGRVSVSETERILFSITFFFFYT